MKKYLAGLSLLLVTGALLLTACGSGAQSLNFGGSTTVMPIMESAIEAYGEKHPELTISYEGLGSSVGITNVIEGTFSLGGASRGLKDSEKEKGAKATAISLDGVAVIVNSNIVIDNLDLATAAKIFAGQIKNWKDVGGPDAQIVLINRDEASGTRETFHVTCIAEALGNDTKFAVEADIVKSNGDMVQKVGSVPNSIGYCGFGYIDRARNAGAKDILINGIEPKEDNVKNGSYPLSRKLFVVHKGDLKPGSVEEDFVKFLLSAEGQEIVKAEKFIPLP
ncbi:MAG: phosphate ABC transporter substrate-binding protein [Spirochaetales bacterium]|nr:phosphate ABC transporter substrate-binding protein [Spirochaetales bacterium]